MKLDIEAFKKRKEMLTNLEQDTVAYAQRNHKNSMWVSNKRLMMLNVVAAKLEKCGEEIIECASVFDILHLDTNISIPFSDVCYNVVFDRGENGVNVKISIMNPGNTGSVLIFDTIHRPDGWYDIDQLPLNVIEEICTKLPEATEKRMIDILEEKILTMENGQRIAYNNEKEKDIQLSNQMQRLTEVSKNIDKQRQQIEETEDMEYECF